MLYQTVEQVKEDTGYTVKNPVLVTKIGLVFDAYKYDRLDRLWRVSERKALEKMPTFDAKDFFAQVNLCNPNEKTWYSFRYYTPESNIAAGPDYGDLT